MHQLPSGWCAHHFFRSASRATSFSSIVSASSFFNLASNNGSPEVFNTDQGWQFTSLEFTSILKQHGIAISMDGKGRWRDNVFVERLWKSVKYEEVYLYA